MTYHDVAMTYMTSYVIEFTSDRPLLPWQRNLS